MATKSKKTTSKRKSMGHGTPARRTAAKRAPAHSGAGTVSPKTKAMLGKLNRSLAASWDKETADIKRLRRHSLPPMGNMPCVLYANFNTFWLGENIQVMRELALARKMPLGQLNTAAAALLRRHQGRLAKWNLTDTVKLVEALARYFESRGPKNNAEFVQVCEATMVAMDRINAWIDAMIPWSQFDKKAGANRAPK